MRASRRHDARPSGVFPVHPIARSLCNLESIFGQLYPATLLARLVTLEIAGRG